jgi:CTP:phosphocholine cytidylyltransferase-like protein
MNESKEDIIIGLNNEIDDLNFMIEEQAILIKVKLIEKQRVKEFCKIIEKNCSIEEDEDWYWKEKKKLGLE